MKDLTDALIQVAIGLAVLAALFPFALWALRVAKRRRGYAMAAGSLLLLFGVGFHQTPPPPRIAEPEQLEQQAGDDEPK